MKDFKELETLIDRRRQKSLQEMDLHLWWTGGREIQRTQMQAMVSQASWKAQACLKRSVKLLRPYINLPGASALIWSSPSRFFNL